MDFNLFGIPFDINKMFYWLSMQVEAREKKYYVIYQKPVSKTGSVDTIFFFEDPIKKLGSGLKNRVGRVTGNIDLFFLGLKSFQLIISP